MLAAKNEDFDASEDSEIKDSAYVKPELKPENVEFAKRLELAADRSDSVPRMNSGRFSHIQRQLQLHDHSVSRETVRKWFAGEARPRADKMLALSRVLKVDEAWLAVGSSPSALPSERKAMEVHNEAGVNLVMGMMGLAGATIALPDEGSSDSLHFYATIDSRLRKVFVTVGQVSGDTVRFNGPGNFDGVCTIGVVQTGIGSFKLFEIAPRAIANNGRTRGGYVELRGTYSDGMMSLGDDKIPEIKDFRSMGR